MTIDDIKGALVVTAFWMLLTAPIFFFLTEEYRTEAKIEKHCVKTDYYIFTSVGNLDEVYKCDFEEDK